jgi:hypothetical protein
MSGKAAPLSFDSPEQLDLPRGGLVNFTTTVEGMRYDCRLNDRVAGDVLYVIFNGAVDRDKYPVPVFARWNWHALFNAPILAVFDPALHLDPKLRVGWSMGTRTHDATAVMARIATATARVLGIEEGRVVCYGSSSGGFAAITVAARMQQGRFVAYNPQTEVLRYYRGHVRDMAAVFAQGETAEDLAAAHPLRWSAIEALRGACTQGRDVRGVIAQNTVDRYHYEGHYLPFCEAFGLPPQGGTDAAGRFISTMYEDPKGHGPESPDVAKQIVETFVPRLLVRRSPTDHTRLGFPADLLDQS